MDQSTCPSSGLILAMVNTLISTGARTWLEWFAQHKGRFLGLYKCGSHRSYYDHSNTWSHIETIIISHKNVITNTWRSVKQR